MIPWNKQEEQWRVIPGFPDYAASDLGNIKRVTIGQGTKPGKLRTQYMNMNTGYLSVRLGNKRDPDSRKTIHAHKVIAMTWIPNPEALTGVVHLNGIKTDNRVCNLKWGKAKADRDTIVQARCIESGEITYHKSPAAFCKAFDITASSTVYIKLDRQDIYRHPYKDLSWELIRVPKNYEQGV